MRWQPSKLPVSGWPSLLVITLLSLSQLGAAARSISEDNATNAIVGEAAGCPYIVKLGVASAIHNRGTLHGVYGFNAARNASEPAWVWADARRAWRESSRHDIVHGARFFGCKADVDKGTFIGLTFVCKLGKDRSATYFFR